MNADASSDHGEEGNGTSAGHGNTHVPGEAMGPGQQSGGHPTAVSMNGGHFLTPNPPLHRTSTILFESTDHLAAVQRAMLAGEGGSLYATYGTPTTAALADLVARREEGDGAVFAPSGLAAVSLALLAVLRPGDHLLMVDACYGPTRSLCDGLLARLGVEVEYYEPACGGAIASMIRPSTRAVFMESPGSFTFDVQDIPAIVAAVRAAEVGRESPIYTMIDNAWGSPGLLVPLSLGVDISVVPLTKYWGGHADFVLGAVIGNGRSWRLLRGAAWDLGLCAGADDAALAMRGAHTADVRLERHARSALEVADWLARHPRVGTVLHPAHPSSPGHALWRRDFRGSNGLLSFELLMPDRSPAAPVAAAAIADALVRSRVFGLGYSWGGYESLVMPGELPNGTSHHDRSVRRWGGGTLLRLHVGLAPVEELIGALRDALGADA